MRLRLAPTKPHNAGVSATMTGVPAIGQLAPDFTLPGTPEGKPVTLSEFRGHKVVLAFYVFDFSPG